MQHLISVDDLDSDFISTIFERASYFKRIRRNPMWYELSYILSNRLMISDFFEPSTRTRLSFEAAMTYLGGNVIGTENAAEFSSIKKGESIADNFRVISGYCDIIVGRFLKEGDARIASDASLVPLLNGGDGAGEHPTQALIDLFSITENPPLRNTVTFVGDNKYSRTVRSLARLLARYDGISQINFIGPPEMLPDEDFNGGLYDIARANGHAISIGTFDELHQRGTAYVIQNSDVVYVTRSQTERHSSKTAPENFIFTPELADLMPETGLIMHPLPRREELPVAIDSNPRAYYFQQAHNGLYIRMALLEALCQN